MNKATYIIIILSIYILVSASSYSEGVKQAEEYVEQSNDKMLWFLGGAGAGFICPGCGCVAAPLTGYFFDAEISEEFSERSNDFKTGFRKVYVPRMKKMRAKYAFAGAGIGSVLSIAIISYIIYTLM